MLTHEMRAVLEYCNRMILIEGGAVILDEHPAIAFKKKKDLLESYQIKLPVLAELFYKLRKEQNFILPRNNEECAKLLLEQLNDQEVALG